MIARSYGKGPSHIFPAFRRILGQIALKLSGFDVINHRPAAPPFSRTAPPPKPRPNWFDERFAVANEVESAPRHPHCTRPIARHNVATSAVPTRATRHPPCALSFVKSTRAVALRNVPARSSHQTTSSVRGIDNNPRPSHAA